MIAVFAETALRGSFIRNGDHEPSYHQRPALGTMLDIISRPHFTRPTPEPMALVGLLSIATLSAVRASGRRRYRR